MDQPFTVHLGDCVEVMRTLPDNSVDMVLTDMPYGVVSRSSQGLRNLDKGVADVMDFDLEEAMAECVRVCKSSFYVFCGTEQVSFIRRYFVDKGLTTRLGIWEKTNPSPMNGQRLWLSSVECCVFARAKNAPFHEHCKSSVWRFPTARGKLHPTMKPVPLMKYLINASSNIGDVVLDFTMGSGTTGVACMETGRRFIGVEKDPEYLALAEARIASALPDWF